MPSPQGGGVLDPRANLKILDFKGGPIDGAEMMGKVSGSSKDAKQNNKRNKQGDKGEKSPKAKEASCECMRAACKEPGPRHDTRKSNRCIVVAPQVEPITPLGRAKTLLNTIMTDVNQCTCRAQTARMHVQKL